MHFISLLSLQKMYYNFIIVYMCISMIDVKKYDSCFDFMYRGIANGQRYLNLEALSPSSVKRTSLIC